DEFVAQRPGDHAVEKPGPAGRDQPGDAGGRDPQRQPPLHLRPHLPDREPRHVPVLLAGRRRHRSAARRPAGDGAA
nr:hypothetical protein [Tanacetum cinerariifolium]